MFCHYPRENPGNASHLPAIPVRQHFRDQHSGNYRTTHRVVTTIRFPRATAAIFRTGSTSCVPPVGSITSNFNFPTRTHRTGNGPDVSRPGSGPSARRRHCFGDISGNWDGGNWVGGTFMRLSFFFRWVARVINSLERATAKRAVIGRYNLSIKYAKRVYY